MCSSDLAAGADLDDPASLATFDFSADCLLHSAPPPGNGEGDSRTVHLAAALAHAGKCGVMVPRHIVYLGTSGVYGDCAGDWVDETRALNPQSARASRRVHAEQVLHQVAAELGASLIVLRVPGIYAADRLPLARLRASTPVLCDEDDVYTNHVHAEDLAGMIALALAAQGVSGVFNANDDTQMKMAEYFDLVAERYGLPRPRRITRKEARTSVSPELLSFWSESRRLVNRRIKEVLGVRLRYPTVREGVPSMVAAN